MRDPGKFKWLTFVSKILTRYMSVYISDHLEAHVRMIYSTIPMRDSCPDRIRSETVQYSQLVTLMSIILNGWFKHMAQCQLSIRDF